MYIFLNMCFLVKVVNRSLLFNVTFMFSNKGFPRNSCSFWSKTKGYNIPVNILLTTSKGTEYQNSDVVLLYSRWSCETPE